MSHLRSGLIRLYGGAKELREKGRITLPRPDKEELVEIRKGKYPLSEIREIGKQLDSEALVAPEKSPLADRVDREAINRLRADTQLQFWRASGPREDC